MWARRGYLGTVRLAFGKISKFGILLTGNVAAVNADGTYTVQAQTKVPRSAANPDGWQKVRVTKATKELTAGIANRGLTNAERKALDKNKKRWSKALPPRDMSGWDYDGDLLPTDETMALLRDYHRNPAKDRGGRRCGSGPCAPSRPRR